MLFLKRINSKIVFKLNNHFGFSLAEVMITIAILAIILNLAAPSFRRMLADQKLQSAATNLLMTLREIRAKAINGTGTNSAPGKISFVIGVDREAGGFVKNNNKKKFIFCDENEQTIGSCEANDMASLYENSQIQFNDEEDIRRLRFKPDGTVVECTLSLNQSDFSYDGSESNVKNIGFIYKEISNFKNITESCYVFQMSSAGIIKLERGKLCAKDVTKSTGTVKCILEASCPL